MPLLSACLASVLLSPRPCAGWTLDLRRPSPCAARGPARPVDRGAVDARSRRRAGGGWRRVMGGRWRGQRRAAAAGVGRQAVEGLRQPRLHALHRRAGPAPPRHRAAHARASLASCRRPVCMPCTRERAPCPLRLVCASCVYASAQTSADVRVFSWPRPARFASCAPIRVSHPRAFIAARAVCASPRRGRAGCYAERQRAGLGGVWAAGRAAPGIPGRRRAARPGTHTGGAARRRRRGNVGVRRGRLGRRPRKGPVGKKGEGVVGT